MRKAVLKAAYLSCLLMISQWQIEQSDAITLTGSFFYDPDRAITAADKIGLPPDLPSSPSLFTNLSSGITGILLVFDDDTVNDIQFRTGNAEDMSSWGTPAAPTITIVNDRQAHIVWESGAVKNRWLEVTYVSANLVRCFGNLAGINNGDYGDCSAGFTDWRLPNRNELYSLVDFSRSAPALQSGHPFTNVMTWRYWSSSARQETPHEAWVVDLYAGDHLCDTDPGRDALTAAKRDEHQRPQKQPRHL